MLSQKSKPNFCQKLRNTKLSWVLNFLSTQTSKASEQGSFRKASVTLHQSLV